MSKMSNIAGHVADVQNELSESLAEWIMDNPLDSYDQYDKDAWINVIQAWFDGTEEGSCPHDWIGEALMAREKLVSEKTDDNPWETFVEMLSDVEQLAIRVERMLRDPKDKIIHEQAMELLQLVSPK